MERLIILISYEQSSRTKAFMVELWWMDDSICGVRTISIVWHTFHGMDRAVNIKVIGVL